MLPLLMVLVGMAVLVAGAEWLVRGASRIALAVGVSPLVIGLTVVAFGTSAPELAVSIGSALAGSGGVAVGNAVGSNTFNVLVVLGASALFGGLVVDQRIVRIDVPILVGLTAGVWAASADGRLSVGEGAVLLAGVVAYTVFSYVIGRRAKPAVAQEYDEAFGEEAQPSTSLGRSAVLLVGGLLGLVGGARLLVDGATTLAEGLGVSDLVIGLTVVAIGTSLPELATSLVAARRGERDIAVGNVVGSNVFNLLAVLGAASVAGGGLDVPAAALATDLPVALLVTLAALPALAFGLRVSPWEGALLLVGYVGYVGYQVLAGSGAAVADPVRAGVLAWLALVGVVFVAVGLRTRSRRIDDVPAEGPGAVGER